MYMLRHLKLIFPQPARNAYMSSWSWPAIRASAKAKQNCQDKTMMCRDCSLENPIHTQRMLCFMLRRMMPVLLKSQSKT